VSVTTPAPLELDAPAAGGKKIRHNQDFQAIAEGWNSTVSAINDGVGWINEACDWAFGSRPLPDLAEYADLEGMIVYPLSGDYTKMRGNAKACETLATGVQQWGGSFGRLALDVPDAVTGDIGTAMMAHLKLYDLALQGVGRVVNTGKVAFNQVATVSERLAVVVENALVKVGQELLKVVGKIRAKFSLVRVSLCYVLLTKGIGIVTDIVDDIRACIDAITRLVEAKDKVTRWAEQARGQMEKLGELVDMIAQIPDAGGQVIQHPGIDERTFEQDLGQGPAISVGDGPDISDEAGAAEREVR